MTVPAALPALAVLLGAALGTFGASPSPGWALGVSVVALAVAGMAFGMGPSGRAGRRGRQLFAPSVCIVFLMVASTLAGDAARSARHPPLREALPDSVLSDPVTLEGELREDAAVGERGVNLALAVDRVRRTGFDRAAPGGVRLTVGGELAIGQARAWRAGRRVRVAALLREPGRFQDPGVPDSRAALARKGVVLIGSVKSAGLVDVLAPGGWVAETAAEVRRLTRAAVVRHVGSHSPRSAAIVVAILIGDRVGLEEEVQRRLQEAGTYHVIAISGGNIAILAGVLLAFFRLARLGPRLGCWLTMAVLVGYAEIVGGGASVVRATLMGCTYLLARQADHRSAPVNALAVSCAVILFVTPASVADVAFWLTFGATLGILIGVGRMGKRLPRPLWIRVPVGLLLTSICAELALFPVGALSFARVTFAGLVLNFLAIPLMGVAQVAGMLVLPLSAVSQTVAGLAGYLAHLGADGLVRSATLVDYAPWSSYRLPPPGLFVVFGYYLGWTMWLWLRSPTAVAVRGRWRRVMSRLAAAAIVGCGLWVLVEPMTLLWPGVSGRLRVTVLDVGHGDAILVQLPDRRSVLVDAGGSMTGGSFDLGGRVVAPALWSLGTRRLDALVISHADPDHIGGAASILRDFRPREIWEAVPVAKSPLWQALRRDADGARIAWHSRHAGDVVVLGDVRCRVWHPPPPEWERPRPRNDDSLVMELEYGEVSIVLPGDIGRPVESVLARESWPRRLRVLKVPHHGSATSSLPEFLGGLAPTLAILSAGATTKVSDDVLRRYTELGATMLRTDVDGAITLETDGRTITVTTFTGRRLSVDGTTKNTKVTKGVERVDSTRRSVGLQPTARKTGRNCCPALGNRSSHR